MAPTSRDISPLEPEPRQGVGEIRRTRVDGVMVVTPQGLLDADDLSNLEQLLREVADPIIIDMGDCMLGRSDLLARLDPERWGRDPDDVCVVCRRYSARLLLARTGVAHRIAVFGGFEDALRARSRRTLDGRTGWSR